MSTPSTFLFVPAHDAQKAEKAFASSADAVILDLEDAVPDHLKGAARRAAADVVANEPSAGARAWVRVNAAGSPHYEDDLSGIPWSRCAGLVLPKAEEPDTVRALGPLGIVDLLLLLESVSGLGRVGELVAAAPVPPRLALGTWDLVRDLDLAGVEDPDDSELVWHVRCEVVLESRRLRLAPPVDGVFARLEDVERFARVTMRVRRLGFGGKLLVHPAQLVPATAIFGQDARRIEDARALLDAYERAVQEGRGAVRFRGEMIDRVHVERARALLAQATSGQRAMGRRAGDDS